MRLKLRKCVPLALTVNIILIFILYYLLQNTPDGLGTGFYGIETRPLYTLILRDVEDFENDISQTLMHIKDILGDKIPVMLIFDSPYSIVDVSVYKNVRKYNIGFDLKKKLHEKDILDNITSEFIIFVPDGVRILSKTALETFVQDFKNAKYSCAFAVKTGAERLTCPGLHVNLQRWRVKITEFKGSEGMCDYIEGNQAIIMRTDTLRDLPSPLSLPLTKSLYIQFVVKKWKSFVYELPVFSARVGFRDTQNHLKHKRKQEKRTKELFKKFKIKQLIYKTDDNEELSYYGCNKFSEKCFEKYINNTPDFIYEGKWTPPCCLKAIRETAVQVFNIFESKSVRYWLQGTSLLGAFHSGNIIPWDYKIDIGVYKEDVQKCTELMKADIRPHVDEKGFVWEKIDEEDLYRVYFSEVNSNHVDILIFYPKKGVMKREQLYGSHLHEDFPEHYLKPFLKINFIGRNVSAPNKIKKFLEMKLGENAVEKSYMYIYSDKIPADH